MQEFATPTRPPARRGPFFEIVLLAVFVLCGLLVGNLIGLMAAMPLTGGDFTVLQRILNNAQEHGKGQLILLILQAAAASFAFIFAPLIYLQLIERRSLGDLSPNRGLWAMPVLLTALLVIAFMPFNALLIEWNRNIDLPAFFDGLEGWAKSKESALEELTKKLTQFSSVPALLGGLVVIALIPAVGEELVFRGLIQPKIYKMSGNIHVAVWLTGFIFSFIHLQFYGLFPRMLLGVLFGYLYVWSGNLWYSILGHFINNGFTLIMYYLHQRQSVNLNIEDTASVPWGISLAFMAVSAFLLISLKTYFSKTRVSSV